MSQKMQRDVKNRNSLDSGSARHYDDDCVYLGGGPQRNTERNGRPLFWAER